MTLAFVLGGWSHALLCSSSNSAALVPPGHEARELGTNQGRAGKPVGWDITREGKLIVGNRSVVCCVVLCALPHQSPVRKTETKYFTQNGFCTRS